MFTGDLGRKIHRRKVLGLHKHLEETITRAYRSAENGLFIRLTLPGRLTCAPAQPSAIDKALSAALVSGTLTTKAGECDIQVSDFSVGASRSMYRAHLTYRRRQWRTSRAVILAA
jgi:hypothetical protein